jgi:glycosyltransferase involved in cell wall biosynthesis
MENPKVLIGAPTYKGMKYCHKEFYSRIKNLTYKNYNVLIVDNSEDDEYFKELKKEKGIKVLKDNRKEENKMQVLANSRNLIIDYALENSFDYLLTMDPDVIPPKNIIEELLNCKKDIVSGLYFNDYESSGEMKYLPVAFQFITEEQFKEILKTTKFPPFVKSHEDLRRHLTQEEVDSGKLLKVKQPSIGCTLSSKKVFGKVRHGLFQIEGVDPGITGEDAFYFHSARKAGFDLFVFTKIKCDHLVKGKYETDAEGNLVHPLFK